MTAEAPLARATEVVPLEQARAALEQVATIPEAKDLHDAYWVARSLLRKRGAAREQQNAWAALHARASRKLGHLIAQMPKHPPGPDPSQPASDPPPRLADLGIGKDTSSRCQAIAALPVSVFEGYLEQTASAGEEITTAGLLRLARRLGLGPQRSRRHAPFDDAFYERNAAVLSERANDRLIGLVDLVPALLERLGPLDDLAFTTLVVWQRREVERVLGRLQEAVTAARRGLRQAEVREQREHHAESPRHQANGPITCSRNGRSAQMGGRKARDLEPNGSRPSPPVRGEVE